MNGVGFDAEAYILGHTFAEHLPAELMVGGFRYTQRFCHGACYVFGTAMDDGTRLFESVVALTVPHRGKLVHRFPEVWNRGRRRWRFATEIAAVDYLFKSGAIREDDRMLDDALAIERKRGGIGPIHDYWRHHNLPIPATKAKT